MKHVNKNIPLYSSEWPNDIKITWLDLGIQVSHITAKDQFQYTR